MTWRVTITGSRLEELNDKLNKGRKLCYLPEQGLESTAEPKENWKGGAFGHHRGFYQQMSRYPDLSQIDADIFLSLFINFL